MQLWPQPLGDCVPAVTLSPCGTDNTLELVENTASNQVTCTGFTASDTAVWRVLIPTDNQIATCAAPSGSSGPDTCINAVKPPFTASRTVSDRTSLTVDTTDEATYGIVFKGTTLVCRTNTQTNDQGDQCRMDLVGECNRLFSLFLSWILLCWCLLVCLLFSEIFCSFLKQNKIQSARDRGGSSGGVCVPCIYMHTMWELP